MTALTKDRATPERDGRNFSDPLAAGATIYAGGMYLLDASGAAMPAAAQAAVTTLKVRAVALQRAAASAGATLVNGARGVFRMDNAAGVDELTRADIGATCYALDDATVAKDHDTNKRPAAGTVVDVDDAGVWVRIGA